MLENQPMRRKGIVLWFTGLSGAGKTTVAEGALQIMEEQGLSVRIIDGDDIRNTCHRHLGFSENDIKLNNSLIADMCSKERYNFDVIMVPIISPYRDSRSRARDKLGSGFYEIYFSANIDCVRERDVKGLYEKTDRGKIKNMIGVSSDNPYQAPNNADYVINTEKETVDISIQELVNFILRCHMVADKFESNSGDGKKAS